MKQVSYDQAELTLMIHNINMAVRDAQLNVSSAMDDVSNKYDLLMEYYESENTVEEVFQEAGLFGKKKKQVEKDLTGLSHMKFDNKKIIEAISYFNAARAEFDTNDETKVNMLKLVNSKNFKKGVKCLESQFDCKIIMSNLVGIAIGSATIPNHPFTYFSKITLSKSRGFKLGGMPILMGVGMGEFEAKIIRSTPEMFGQSITAVILHEIWHNISVALHTKTTELMAATSTIANMPKNMPAKQRRILIINYIGTIERYLNKKMDPKKKKKLIKKLAFLTATKLDKKALKMMVENNTDNEDFDDVTIDVEKQINDMFVGFEPLNTTPGQIFSLLIITAATVWKIKDLVSVFIGATTASTNPIGLIITIAQGIFAMIGMSKNLKKDLFNEKDYEEFNADLFSAMYQLPVVFKIYDKKTKKSLTPNELSKGDLKLRSRLNKLGGIAVQDVHPGNYERNYSSYKIAKKLLDGDAPLDPSIKKYLEWIVQNFSSLNNLDLEEMYDDKLFDPAEADMLDKHLEQIAKSKRVTITEYDMMIILTDGVIVQG